MSSKGIDLTGLTFGPFYVIGVSEAKELLERQRLDHLSGKYWKCKCNLCGRIKNYRSDVLRKRVPTSCGCLGHAIEIGDKVGHLTIEKRIEENTRNPRWECRCECGNIVIRTSTCFKRNWNVSCGCLHKKHLGNKHPSYKGYKNVPMSFFTRSRVGAEKRNIIFDITIEQINDLYEKQNRKCVLSGMDITFGNKSRDPEKHIECTASLDRINSSLGYSFNNIQLVHKEINFMKRDLEQKHFINICETIYRYNVKCL